MDVYDREIERLVKLDGIALADAWGCDRNGHPQSALFLYCSQDGQAAPGFDGTYCGCLTQVRFGKVAQTEQLTNEIRRDLRIPRIIHEPAFRWSEMSVDERRAFLEVFAEWQRAMDATIRQGKKWHPEFSPLRQKEHASLSENTDPDNAGASGTTEPRQRTARRQG